MKAGLSSRFKKRNAAELFLEERYAERRISRCDSSGRLMKPCYVSQEKVVGEFPDCQGHFVYWFKAVRVSCDCSTIKAVSPDGLKQLDGGV